MDFPYKSEYAKSGRASCRSCKSPIGKETLRLAVMVQSPMFDGKQPHWYHYKCFFGKQRPKTTDDIEHFESLRWEDQEKIRDMIKNASDIVVPGKKGKKRATADSGGALKDFNIEYAKSGRAACRGCELKILKDEVRISKKDFESDVGKRYGGQDKWHHVSCFAKLRSELGYYESGEKLPGYKNLKKADKDDVATQIPAIKQEAEPELKKVKKEEVDPLDAQIKQQSKMIYKHRDALKKNLSKKELQYLLEHNKQEIPPGEERILDRLADLMTFGRLLPCAECGDGQLVFNKVGYVCHGDLTEWTKCNTVTKEPMRVKFTIPKELSEEYPFLKKYKFVPGVRVCKDVCPTAAIKKDEVDAGPKVERERPALYEMQFVILGGVDKDDLKKQITKLGGKVVTKINEKVMAVISNAEEVEKMGSRMTLARESDVHVIPSDFLQLLGEYKGRVPDLIVKKSICDWGSDPHTRLPEEPSTSMKSKSRSMYTSSLPSKVTLKLKGGTAVDPDSGLDDKAHVYQSGDDKYTAVLGITDLQKQKNSYYKIQLLEADKGGKYWVFRAWGRIGTTIGSNKLEKMDSLHEAKNNFKELYEEKSGNCWEMRHDFMKVPGRMYPIDIDYGEDEAKLDIKTDVPSKLPVPVQKLMQLIFNIDLMKKVMLEFELDTEKMPLGKLSKTQMKKAYTVLSELQELITNAGSKPRFIDASNRFYTFIPHAVGVDELPLLNNEEIIKKKIEMIDNLMELEIAYNLMKSTSSSAGVDGHYDQLNTDLGVLDRDSEEFKLIQEYVTNTHASTHSNYELEIVEIFTVKRQGEEKRFKPFRKMHNRKLLWHGSRVTNFAGILSQGLRIAPPEAPVTGYMFGKGIYFADMVSKSANYCCTGVGNPTGVMLLCDVALGDMYERTNAEYVEKLPKGKHSCKGVGRTEPDSGASKKIHDIEIPLGKPVTDDKLKTSLLYNEFIVYDVAQVNVKYLLQMNFKYNY